jgi:ferredoxin
MRALDRADLDTLFSALRDRGWTVVGPTVRDGAIVYDEIGSSADLPGGWTDRQGAGSYRLERRGDNAVFGFTTGPQSWKKFLFPPALRLFRAERKDGGPFTIRPEAQPDARFAFVGVRPCELAAIARQDRVFLDGAHQDPLYRARRQGAFIVAVQCGEAGGTCFCASLGTGPHAGQGFDLALTEVLTGGRHAFLVEPGSPQGAGLLAELPTREAAPAEIAVARDLEARATESMGRQLDTRDLHGLLHRSYNSRCWDQAAERCLACGNCTMVCPTCFCSTVEDTTDLTATVAERWRRWDSCFTVDFSYLHGGSVRSTPASRYRQWITHKLATWNDQFGTSGCVGCGRCITWCPAGLDLTDQVRALRAEGGDRVHA